MGLIMGFKLKKYEAKWRAPLSLRLNEATLYNAPPPTQGLASLIILGIFEELGVKVEPVEINTIEG